MTIVNTESIEHDSELLHVFRHVGPEPGVLSGAGAVAELDTVAPDDDFSAEVGFRGELGKVLEGVGVPDPAVIGDGECRFGEL